MSCARSSASAGCAHRDSATRNNTSTSAATVKLTGLVALPGLLWARPRHRRAAAAAVIGAAGVAVPWVLLTPGAFTQLRHASSFATPAAPWRSMFSVIQPLLGHGAARLAVAAIAGVIGLRSRL